MKSSDFPLTLLLLPVNPYIAFSSSESLITESTMNKFIVKLLIYLSN